MSEKGQGCKITEPEGYAELELRCRKAAWSVCYGRENYEDTVQDMLLWIVEKQAADPAYADNHPSYQVKFAMRRAQDKRRPDRGQDVMRRSPMIWVDGNSPDGEDTDYWYERLAGDPGSDVALLVKGDMEALAELLAKVREAIADELSPRQQEIIINRFYRGLLTGDVAVAMGISKGTVCSQSKRAMDKLRAILAEYYERYQSEL